MIYVMQMRTRCRLRGTKTCNIHSSIHMFVSVIPTMWTRMTDLSRIELMSHASQPSATVPQRLEHYPVPFFAIGMGMMGLTLATHAAETAYGLGSGLSHAVLAVSLAMIGLISLGYLLKLVKHPAAVRHEWNHPVRIAFFPAISITFLLLSVALSNNWPAVAHWVWMVAAALQGLFALAVIGSWIGHRPFQHGQLTPAWFIPAVGNVIVPIAGVKFGHTEISWLFFSGGLIFWIVLLTLVMNRLVFHDPLPGKMVPTLMILVAPPAVAFVSWLRLNGGEPGAFGHVLLSLGYVFALLVVTQIAKFKSIPFALSWWALSFPVAALSIASFAYAGAAQSAVHKFIGSGLLMLLAGVVVMLLVRTALAIRARQICVPE